MSTLAIVDSKPTTVNLSVVVKIKGKIIQLYHKDVYDEFRNIKSVCPCT